MTTLSASSASDRRGPVRRLRFAVAMLVSLLLAAGGVLVAAPAHAHDELVSSDPAADAAVDTLPAQLTLTFSGELATDPGATELAVTDATGASLADGEPVVAGTVVTQALAGAASGVVTVLWKVVSSDGHPISGEYAFTVTAAPSPTATPTDEPTTEPTDEPDEIATPEPLVTATPASDDSSFGDVWPWIVGGLLVAGLGGAVLYLLVSRARREKELERTRADALSGGGSTPSAPPADGPADR